MELLLGRKEAAQFLQLEPPNNILDVATGTGALAYELAKAGHRVTGVDVSINQIYKARQYYSSNLDLRFQQANATKMPFGNSEFDAASISFALHDMPYSTGVKVLEEMKRVTKRGGKILLVDYCESKKHWAAGLVYPLIKLTEGAAFEDFMTTGLDRLLNKVGLVVEKERIVWGLVQIVVAVNLQPET